MRDTRPSLKAITGIIFRLVFATGFVWLADVLWPETLKWWGFGLYAILFYAGAIILAVAALRMTVEEIIRLIRVKRFKGDAHAPRADKLAGDQEMHDGGLL